MRRILLCAPEEETLCREGHSPPGEPQGQRNLLETTRGWGAHRRRLRSWPGVQLELLTPLLRGAWWLVSEEGKKQRPWPRQEEGLISLIALRGNITCIWLPKGVLSRKHLGTPALEFDKGLVAKVLKRRETASHKWRVSMFLSPIFANLSL